MAKPKAMKITVLLSEDEFSRFDGFCRERGFKKSTLLARLIRQFLDMEGYGVVRESAINRFGRGAGSR